MYWPDRVAKEIIESGKFKPYWVDDMFTPSGYAHIGSLRGPLVHDFIYKSLLDEKQKVIFTYILNDFDPLDGLPPELERDFSKFMGKPLRDVPSPQKGFDSFADYFANDYLNVMANLGVVPEIKSSYDMYHQGLFDEAIREALDHAEEIQKIYLEISGSRKKEGGWLPLQVVCPSCGKLGTTKVSDWDGDTVAFTCEPNLVTWAKGCGESSRISPFKGNGKLPWKVDWPAHWKVLGVTIEGAGKDHSVAGGSRDIARELVKGVFHIKEPYNLPYEFFTLEGKKMSSSKGLGLKARDLSQLLPNEAARFLFARTDYKKEIDFDVFGTMAISDLFDEYDRCFMAYVNGSDEDLGRVFEMAQIDKVPAKEKIFLPRFIDVVNYLQQASINIEEKFESIKGRKLSEEELKILKERVTYAKVWLEKFAPDEYRLQMVSQLPEQAKQLDNLQKEFLRGVIELLGKDLTAEKLQFEIFELTKSLKIESKKAFAAIYIPMLGKEFGPKAAWFLKQYKKEDVIKRLQEVIQ